MEYNGLKIYFAHPISTYDSDIEIKAIQLIKEKFPDAEIINPKNIASHDMLDFYNVINECDIFVALVTESGISLGVLSELYYVLKFKPMPIYDGYDMERLENDDLKDVIPLYEKQRIFSKDYEKMQKATVMLCQ